MPTSTALRDRYRATVDRIAAAATRAGRRPEEIHLVAVSKSATVGQIVEVAALGQRDFGENRIQSLMDRLPEIDQALASAGGPTADSLRWHMIGSLQRNKVRKTIELCRLIHSVENMKLAEAIHEEAMKRDRVVEVLVQVNVSGETSKHGMNPRAVKAVLEQMQTMAGLELRGLMTMAPLTADAERARPVFLALRELFEEVRADAIAGARFNVLSMGMSSDFEVAVECGANVVRVGTAIFGE